MEVNSYTDAAYSPSGGDVAVWLPKTDGSSSGTSSVVVTPFRRLVASFALGTSLCLAPEACAMQMPNFGTSPLVDDARPTMEPAADTRPADRASTYRRLLVGSVADQAREAMAALSLTKSQLADVLRVSRPTVYDWLGGKEPSPGNAGRLSAVLRLLARAGVSSEAPLNARFVRHAIDERNPSLIELLSAEQLNESQIEGMIVEARALGEEAESRRTRREDRLRALGYEDASNEQRRDQMNQTVAMLDWPKR
jgi:transcriptional regulator with XRE-family HTH domain